MPWQSKLLSSPSQLLYEEYVNI